ncbi:MAG: hypothetical protein ACE5IM_06135, partial [Nitrospinota bacterium]
GTATVHDWRRHIILLGLGREAVKNLPVPLNGLSTRYFWTLLPGTLLFLIPTFLSLFLILFRGWLRWVGMAIFLVGLLGTIDAHPFKPTPFNPYLGPQGARPYQEIIDYAEEKGGIALWAHQGSRLHKTKAGPVFLETKPYTHLLLETIHFRGLDAIYEDRFTASKPGQQWDMLLSAYAQKRIPYPVWGYGGLDFHSEKELNGKKRLSDILTVFALRKLSEDAVLRALVNGRFYVVRSYSPSRLKMDHFSISSRDGKIKGSYGEALKFKGPPKISFQISTEDGKSVKVKVKLIRLGEVIKFIEGPTPLRVDYTDPDEIKATSLYYRIDAKVNNREHLITNPVFIHR